MLQGSALTQRLPNARDLPINSPLYKLHPEVMGLYRSAMPNRPARLRWNRRAMVVRRGDTRRASVKLHITRKLDDSVECRFHHSRVLCPPMEKYLQWTKDNEQHLFDGRLLARRRVKTQCQTEQRKSIAMDYDESLAIETMIRMPTLYTL